MKNDRQVATLHPLKQTLQIQSPLQIAAKLWRMCEDSYRHGSPWTQEQFIQDLEQPTAHYLIYQRQDKWLGFVSYHQVFDEVDITHVVVEKDVQGSGFGRDMLKRVIQQLYTEDVQTIFLEVRHSNVAALRLYQELGFQALRVRKNYYSGPVEDGLEMQLITANRTKKEENGT